MAKQTKKLVTGGKLSTKARIGLGVLLVISLLTGYVVFVEPWLFARRQEVAIRGLADDYPKLVSGLEKAISEELTIESGCFTTQEKFSGGVSSCQLIAVSGEVSGNQEQLAKEYFMSDPVNFITGEHFTNNTGGYNLDYNNKDTCDAIYDSPILVECGVGYSRENAKLINELLNADRLNQIKDNL